MVNSINLVVMGKTGAGKSTLINAVLREDLAPTGTGSAVTREVHKYSKQIDFRMPSGKSDSLYQIARRQVNMYDTVGLEIGQAITQKTLRDIRNILSNAKSNDNEQDITLVWFCLSASSSRFEPYEADLIKALSIEYEIPFVIVITQCFSNEKGELEKAIEIDLPELAVVRVLAKDYKVRGGNLPAFGVEQLLSGSLLDFNNRKIRILESKLDQLRRENVRSSEELNKQGKAIVKRYSNKAGRATFLPIAGIPFVHVFCGKMIKDLNRLYEIKESPRDWTDVIVHTIVGAVITPMMAVPGLGAAAASGYIEAIGEEYLKILPQTVPGDTSSADIVRILKEIEKRKKEKES